MMTIAQIMEKMIAFSEGNIHDITHLSCVWTYAKTIGELEGLDAKTQFILEVAAITHDIACPLCREKYGHADGKHQEIEGQPIARAFLAGTGLDEDVIERVVYLVGHHQTLTNVEGIDYQILLEADYLVNADEAAFSRENILNTRAHLFKTATGTALLDSIYSLR